MSDEIIITRNNSSKDSPLSVSYPTERVDLPSKGHFYSDSDPLSLGYVDMKMMTAKEEDILTSQNLIKKGVVLDKLLESLIATPNVNIENLLLCDKNALFVAARRLAYGDSYGPVQIKCQKCFEESKTVVNLGELREKSYEFENVTKGHNQFEFQLPYSKKVVTFKLLSSKDETDIDGELKATAKFTKSGGSTEITTRLKKMIISIDGKTDRSSINKFVESELLSKDSIALRTYARELSPELDMTFNFVCSSCGHEERMDVPMTVQFFWPEY
jgi:hypothetical protein